MGRIAAPYGVKGWVKVQPMTSEPEALLGYPQWWVRRRGSEGAWQAHTLESGRQHGATLLAQLSGLPDREAAALLAGAEIGVPRSALPPVAEDEFYWADLVGLEVINTAGERLGKVTGLIETGANAVMRVVDDVGLERLLPFVSAVIQAVDGEAGRIRVEWGSDW